VVFLILSMRMLGWYSILNCGKTASFHNLAVTGGCSRQCELLRSSFNRHRCYLTAGYDSCRVPGSITIGRSRARARVCMYFGVATRYELSGPWIESQWGARFSAPIRNGPRTDPASCMMGTGSLSQG